MEKKSQMEEVLFQIGAELGRSREEIEPIVKLLKEHWIDSLEIWKRLPAESKKVFKLPLMLELRLDQLSATETKINATSSPSPLSAAPKQLGVELKDGMFHCSFNDMLFPLGMADPLSVLLERLSDMGKAAMYSESTGPPLIKRCDEKTEKDEEVEEKRSATNLTLLPPETELTYALIPGNILKINDTTYQIERKPEVPDSCVERWLRMVGLERYVNLFARHRLDDYFSLLFLRKQVLELMGLNPAEEGSEAAHLMQCINKWLQLSEPEFVGQWVEVLGFPQYAKRFIEEGVTLGTICTAIEDENDFDGGITSKEDRKKLFECFQKYKNFSSVEETFTWLRSNGFQKYSFHFARYNIPFYALPFVNFFIIDEMGVTHDDQLLLDALQELKNSPAYLVKAMAYWLRDLEMERYNLRFAREAIVDLEVLTMLEDRHINDLIPFVMDSRKMKEALKEMKEFQYHYSATAALLQELGMYKYAKLFSMHGISVGVLPLLKEKQLIEMGITDDEDRQKVLRAIDKIKNHLPAGVASWLNEYHNVPPSEESAPPSMAPEVDDIVSSSSPSLAPNTFSVAAAGKKAKQRERRKRKAQAFAAKKSDGSGL